MEPIARCPACTASLAALTTQLGVVTLEFDCGTTVFINHKKQIPMFGKKCFASKRPRFTIIDMRSLAHG